MVSLLSEQYVDYHHLPIQRVPTPEEWGWIDDADSGWMHAHLDDDPRSSKGM